jgi:hypothetical protein
MNKKIFFRMLILILFFCLIFVGLFINKIRIKHDKQIITLTEKSRIGKTVIRSQLKTPYKLVVTLKGSLNDTIMFDSKKIPPSRIDKEIHNSDWYADSAWFYFDAYKATKLNLEVVFCFYE